MPIPNDDSIIYQDAFQYIIIWDRHSLKKEYLVVKNGENMRIHSEAELYFYCAAEGITPQERANG